MPRTKQIRKRNSNNTEADESELLVKDFDKQVRLKIRKIEAESDMLIKGFMNKIDISLSLMPDEIRGNITLGDLLDYQLILDNVDDEKNVTSTSDDHVHIAVIPPTASKSKKISKRQTATSMDDGYVTESGIQQKNRQHVSRIDTSKSTSKRLVRQKSSNSQSGNENIRPRTRSSSNNRVTSNSRVNNKLVTPAFSRLPNEYNLITPKFKPNTPINILRRPREGEMALSMQGSPLLPLLVTDRTANINLPLSNGDVVSILPNDGLRLSNIPKLDEETMRQLETLRGHIEKVIGKTYPKANFGYGFTI